VVARRVLVPNKTIEIRLDKLDDAYGSPGLEDIERFSRALAQVRSCQSSSLFAALDILKSMLQIHGWECDL
jgi:hypothetical protein